MRSSSTVSPPSRYSPAMTGTSFSVTEASRWVPPKKIKPPMTASTMPTAQLGMPKAV